jgi:hypothetical protein
MISIGKFFALLSSLCNIPYRNQDSITTITFDTLLVLLLECVAPDSLGPLLLDRPCLYLWWVRLPAVEWLFLFGCNLDLIVLIPWLYATGLVFFAHFLHFSTFILKGVTFSMLGIVCNYTLLEMKFASCIFSHCSKSIEKKIKKRKELGWLV